MIIFTINMDVVSYSKVFSIVLLCFSIYCNINLNPKIYLFSKKKKTRRYHNVYIENICYSTYKKHLSVLRFIILCDMPYMEKISIIFLNKTLFLDLKKKKTKSFFFSSSKHMPLDLEYGIILKGTKWEHLAADWLPL